MPKKYTNNRKETGIYKTLKNITFPEALIVFLIENYVFCNLVEMRNNKQLIHLMRSN